MNERQRNSIFKFVFVIAAILLVALSVSSYISVTNLADASAWVTHTHKVKLELELALRALVQAESAQRGYLHSRDSIFLDGYDQAIRQVATHIDSVETFTRDNPSQQENVKKLRVLVTARMDFLSNLIREAPEPVVAAQRLAPGRAIMDSVAHQIEKMKLEEDELMKARSSRLVRESFSTPLLTFILVIGGTLILGAAYFKIVQELRMSELLRITLLEAQQLAHIGSWEWDVRKNKITWSDELYRIYGLAPQQFEADYETFLKYIHPDDKGFVDQAVQKAFKDQQPFAFVHRVVRPDNSVRFLSSTGKVIADNKGVTLRMAGTAQDVTEEKTFESDLEVSEERFNKIFENNPVAMTLAEIKTNKIRYANRAFCSLFGYSKEEVIGRSSEELNLIDPEENARLIGIIMNILQESRTVEQLQALSAKETEELLLRLKESGALKDLEVQYTKKNGEIFSAVVSFEVLAFHTDSFTVTSYQDVTDRKKSENLLKKQNQELAMMNKELESFTYISSHDLQEPLRKIQTFVSRILEEEKSISDRGKEYFIRMQDSANRMQTLIADLLAYSRTTKSESKLEYAHLNEILEEVQEELKELINEKHARVDAGDLGQANVILFQFRQLIQNLIGNALKFSKPGVPPHIVIRRRDVRGNEVKNVALAAEKRYCHISVSDNGIGFDPKYKDQMFGLFARLHDQEEVPGTGIGLAIVKKIVENHQGVVTATGEPNKGATFDIYFPIA